MHDGGEIAWVDVHRGAIRGRKAGIVHPNVDAAELLLCQPAKPANLITVGHIHRQASRPPSSLRQLRQSGFDGIRLPRANDNGRALR